MYITLLVVTARVDILSKMGASVGVMEVATAEVGEESKRVCKRLYQRRGNIGR